MNNNHNSKQASTGPAGSAIVACLTAAASESSVARVALRHLRAAITSQNEETAILGLQHVQRVIRGIEKRLKEESDSVPNGITPEQALELVSWAKKADMDLFRITARHTSAKCPECKTVSWFIPGRPHFCRQCRSRIPHRDLVLGNGGYERIALASDLGSLVKLLDEENADESMEGFAEDLGEHYAE